MGLLSKINPAARFALYFAGAALILSLVTGLVAGIAFGAVLSRSLVLTLVFAGIGFGVHYILQKFVPEVFGALGGTGEEAEKDVVAIDTSELKAEEGEVPAEAPEGGGLTAGGDEFREFGEDDFPRVSGAASEGLNRTLNTTEGKLGKHVLANEKFVKYEPKIMAEAVRSMMSKDED